MPDHEIKYCPVCNALFECKVGSILLCQCQELTLSEEEKDYILAIYTDCLCRNCLQSIKEKTGARIQVKKE